MANHWLNVMNIQEYYYFIFPPLYNCTMFKDMMNLVFQTISLQVEIHFYHSFPNNAT